MALQFRGVAKYGFFAGLIIAGIFVFPTLRRDPSPEMSQAADAVPAMTELVAGKDALQAPAEVAVAAWACRPPRSNHRRPPSHSTCPAP